MRYLSANQFDVYEVIGKGGFGVVYRGIDKVTKEEVAIKQVDLESTDNIEDLQREIKIQSLCRLEQITRYHGCFLKGHKLWIIMEYLDGGSCMDLLAPGPIKEKYIAILLKEVLLALCYLHDNGRIHRDIKAANILVNKKGDVKIADFGVSAQLSSNLSRRNTFVGSPYWMPPEVILEEEYNFKADIWSLGITAIELATGKPPLSHIPPMKVLFQIPQSNPPRLKGSQFSDDFKDFVASCLQLNPNSRESAKKLLQSRFISWASRKSSLSELITRREDWEKDHLDETRNQKRHYIPTIADESLVNKENSFTFDFDDTEESSFSATGNVSEVIITRMNPLKYGTSSQPSILKKGGLGLNSNVVNTNSRDSKKMTDLLVSKNEVRTSSRRSNREQKSLTKDEVMKAFSQTIKDVDCQDDVELAKLEHISLLLQELDETLVASLAETFRENVEKISQIKASNHISEDATSHQTNRASATTTRDKKSKVRASATMAHKVHEGAERPRLGPRKAESEKLLLRRWADQYFV